MLGRIAIAPAGILLLAALSSPCLCQDADTDSWPREITTSKGTVVVYQPQPERFEGDQLEGRSAVAIEVGDDEPVFGAVWFRARLETDRADRTARITDLEVTRVRFPEQDETKAKQLTGLLEQEIVGWNIEIDLDRLLTTLGLVEERAEAAKRMNTDPPVILFKSEPAVLITIDGEPRFVEEDGLERVINTPFTILRVQSSKMLYLCADAENWYAAGRIEGPWVLASEVPADVAARAPEPEEQDEDESTEDPGPTPKIIVATEPTELIVIEGKPEMTPITGTELLHLSNTESDLVFDIAQQRYYLLLSGRWFASAKTAGPWEFVPGEDLPEDFAKIPEDDAMGTVLYAVPGTTVAEEAVLDAQLPQTASVDRKQASLAVEYDGSPKFETIEGTTMLYAVNTATPVIRVEQRYYACDDAVWFVADSATGTWIVAAEVPKVIYTIPPECPIYNVTYVHVYRATPEVVYVGYTPGYTGCYVYGTTVVYGTGWWYRPWYGRYYYARPATWGFHVRYNPWSGWSFGLSYSRGPFRITVGRGGWWGPGRYRSYHRGYSHGARHGARAGYRAGYRAGQRNSQRNNVYRSPGNTARTRPSTRPATQPNRPATAQQAPSRARTNNVHADRDGNVHRRTENGWENRSNGSWQRESTKPDRPATTQQPARPSTQSQRPSTTQQQLNRSHQTRQQGAQRSQSRQRASGGSRGGGRSGGGGRRR